MEALKSPREVDLLTSLVERLSKQAPSNWKCIFLNCELRDTEGGMAASGDLFAVTQRLFGSAKREPWPLDGNSLDFLSQLARLVSSETGQSHVAIDLIISKNGSYKAFADFSPLRRMNGGDDFFKAKHKVYRETEPLLDLID